MPQQYAPMRALGLSETIAMRRQHAWSRDQAMLTGITLAMAVLTGKYLAILIIFLVRIAWRIFRSRVLTIPAYRGLFHLYALRPRNLGLCALAGAASLGRFETFKFWRRRHQYA